MSRLARADNMIEHGKDVEDLEVLRSSVIGPYEDLRGPAWNLSEELIAWIEVANKYRSRSIFPLRYRRERQHNQQLQKQKLGSAVTAP